MNYTPLLKAKKLMIFKFFFFFLLSYSSFGQCNSDVELRSQADVDAFNCTTVSGRITISGPDITDLSTLSSLQEVGSSLIIANNPLLTSLRGLDNLSSIGDELVVVLNPLLATLDGLDALQQLSSIYLDNNPQLETLSPLSGISGEINFFISLGNSGLRDIDGLENITRINGTFELSQSPLLTHVNGLAGLTYTDGTMSLLDCPALTDISGLSNFSRSGGNVIIFQTGLANLNGLEQLRLVDVHLVIQENPLLENLAALAGLEDAHRLTLHDNPNLVDCCGLYNMIVGGGAPFIGEIGENGNPDCNSLLGIVESCQATAPIDLELSMSIAPNQPDAFTFFTQTITLTNQGPSPATNIEVNIPRPAGVVYQGGNEYTATAGAFDTWNTLNWSINRMRKGESATIEINYYKLNSDDLTFYAEVVETSGQDTDSSPGNGTPPTPNEDDEATFTTGISIPRPDLTLSALDAPGTGMTGDVVDFTFDLNNIGTIEAQGSYTIGAYLSTDNQLSSNDILSGTISTGNTPKGTLSDIPGAISVPSNLAPGIYHLILRADIDEEIEEQSENNNIAIVPISISDAPMVCTGDFVIRTQDELNQLAGCEVIDGNLQISSFVNTPDAVFDLSPLINLREITGFLLIQSILATSVEGLNNLEKVKRLIILENTNLQQIDALGKLEVQLDVLVIISNFQLKSLKPLAGIRDSAETLIVTGNHTLKNIDGLEGITYAGNLDVIGNRNLENMNGFQNIKSIGRSLLLVDNNKLQNMSGLSNLESIAEDFIIADHEDLQNVNGLGKLKTVGRAMVLFNNDKLTNINGLNGLESVESLQIRKNDILNDCCGVYNLVANNGADTLIINENPAFCSSGQDIIDNCGNTTGDIDLELSLSVDPVNPAAFTFFSQTVTLTNTGPMTATNVWVDLPAPAGTVYQGGNEFEASQGNFRFWGPQDWEVGELAAGETATLTINYYLLSNDAITFYGQVANATETDGDSTPGNGTCCTAQEDDEASITINLGSSPDLSLSNYNGPMTGIPGDTVDFTFDLDNLGNQVAIGSYTIRAFLSEDNSISADDFMVGFVQTGNTPVGTIAGVNSSISLPSSLISGEYTLILHADSEEQINELDEGNNLLLIPFSILGNSNNRQTIASRKIRIGQLQEIVVERLYPNPAEQFFSMEFSAKTAGDLPIVIYDARGTAVKQRNITLAEGENLITLDVSQLQAGMYYIRFQIPYRHEAIRFAKIRD